MQPVQAISSQCGRLLESPIFTPVHWALAELARSSDAPIEVLNRLAIEREIRNANNHALRFVEPWPASKRFADQYEVRVFERGEVATRRDNWHDLFNALVWLTFPRTKASFNAQHYRELRLNFGASLRGTKRDVLTLFDEGGIIVATSDPSVRERLRRHEWKALFWEGRSGLAQTTRFLVFGHAILEKSMTPYAGVTAKALVLDVPASLFSADQGAQHATVDGAAADYFQSSEALASTRTLGSLPILGVPGWTEANRNPTYYDDERQFRPAAIRDTVAADARARLGGAGGR